MTISPEKADQPDRTPFVVARADLDAACERLVHQIERLNDRLQVALVPIEIGEQTDHLPELVRNPKSELVEKLESVSIFINDRADDIGALVHRLEL